MARSKFKSSIREHSALWLGPQAGRDKPCRLKYMGPHMGGGPLLHWQCIFGAHHQHSITIINVRGDVLRTRDRFFGGADE